MTQAHSTPASNGKSVPDHWQAEVIQQLANGENVMAWLETDLDVRLHFSAGIVLVTDLGLLAKGSSAWQRFDYRRGLILQRSDHAGVGTLNLNDASGSLAQWHYTLAQNNTALRLLQNFERQKNALLTGHPVEQASVALCPNCHSPLPPDLDECPICTRELHVPPSTWTLFRLWRFAKPYRGQLIAGFVLTLASTAATLVPPYLTMPLMDDVLIPFQNGSRSISMVVMLLLLGLLVAALLAGDWAGHALTSWPWCSERIGADLRTTTYEHLLKLSLEYFGGKRTGDLMARIGSETDRICVFLSLHLLDFVTDVLMIVMTAAILFPINPLAGAGHAAAAAVHRLDDPHRARPAAHRLREDRPCLVARSPTCWPTPFPASAWSRPSPRNSASRAVSGRQSPQPAVNDKLNKIWSSVLADRLAADRDRPAGGVGLRHLAGGA